MNIRCTSSLAALGWPQLGLLSGLFGKVVEKIIWISTVLVLRTTKNVISQIQVKIEKRFLADFSRRAMGFPHAFTC